MANVALIPTDKLHCKFVQLVEIVTGVRDLPRLEAQPTDGLQDALKIPPFLRLRVCVVVPEVTMPAIVGSVAEVDEDGFRVSNVKETIRFWREPCVDDAFCRREVLLAKMRVDLGVPADLVQVTQEALRENGARRRSLRSSLRRHLFLPSTSIFLGFLRSQLSESSGAY